MIPRDFLAQADMFPKDMLDHHLANTPNEAIELPDESPEVFTFFHYYLYHYDVTFPDEPCVANEADASDENVKAATEQYVDILCQTWVFGDKYLVPGLQNCAMYKLCEMLSGSIADYADCMSLETMKYCYSHTTPGAKLRNLVADHLVRLLLERHSRSSKHDLIEDLSGYQGFAST